MSLVILFHGVSTLFGLSNAELNFKQFSLVLNSKDLVYKQLNIKTVLFQTIQFSVSTQFKYQNCSISSNSVEHKYTV